ERSARHSPSASPPHGTCHSTRNSTAHRSTPNTNAESHVTASRSVVIVGTSPAPALALGPSSSSPAHRSPDSSVDRIADVPPGSRLHADAASWNLRRRIRLRETGDPCGDSHELEHSRVFPYPRTALHAFFACGAIAHVEAAFR